MVVGGVRSWNVVLVEAYPLLVLAARRSKYHWTYRCICSSSSLIFSAFWTFFGCGFFTTTAGGAESSRPNQFDKSEFVEKSLSNSS